MRQIVRFVLIVALLVAPNRASANAWSIFGYDGESMAKGGALTGAAGGPAAVFYNPAGLARYNETRTVASYMHSAPFLKFKPANNPELLDLSDIAAISDGDIEAACGTLEDSDNCVGDFRRHNEYLTRADGVAAAYAQVNGELNRRARNPQNLNAAVFGFSAPLTATGDGRVIAVGGSVFLPLFDLAYQRIKGPASPYFLQYDDMPHRIVVDLGGAAELFPGFRLGAGADILVDIQADLDVSVLLPAELRLGSILTPEPNLGDIGTAVDGDIRIPLTLAFTAGAQYSPNDSLDFGVAFRDEQLIGLNVKTDIFVYSPFGSESIPVSVKTQARFRPRELAFGGAWHAENGLSLFGDVTWKQWSRFRPEIAIEATLDGSGISSAACNLIKTFADLDELYEIAGEVADISEEQICDLIESNLEDFSDPDYSVILYNVKDNRFKNIFTPAFGISYNQGIWSASGGYRYEPNPTPPMDGLFNIYDANTHVIGAGFNLQLFSFASVGIYTQYRHLQTTTVTKNRAKLLRQTNDADAFPDLDDDVANGPNGEFSSDRAEFDELRERVNEVQILNPAYPSFEIGGGYLNAGLQVNVTF